jgi:pimeloyl-ACP methyl ester carboxylesterase
MPRTGNGSTDIDFDDQGTGEPALLFLPGWCGSRAVFRRLAGLCSQRRRVLSLDWRGHGASAPAQGDFGSAQLLEDALAVIEASGARQVVPVALSHAGWVAIALRRQLGARIPKLVLLDWIVLDPPPPFLGALQALQHPEQWKQAREALFSMWLHGLQIPELTAYVREDMGSYGFDMWSRAGREISAAYAESGNPLQALAAIDAPPVLHLYAQPPDPAYLAAQQAFATVHPWFRVMRLDAQSHFPMLETPERMAEVIESFVA